MERAQARAIAGVVNLTIETIAEAETCRASMIDG